MFRRIAEMTAYLACAFCLSYLAGGVIGWAVEANGSPIETAATVGWSVCIGMFAVLFLIGRPSAAK